MQLCTRQIVHMICGISLLLLADAGIVCAYNPASFEGDGAITDRGFWSYKPRYKIELRPQFSLAAVARHVFNFKGVPSAPLSVFLVIQDNNDASEDLLRMLRTTIELTLGDSSGKEVCHAVGPLRDWKLMWTSERRGAYWQRQCTELRLRAREWYTVTIAVSDVDLTAPSFRVQPMLSGGGWDSP